MTTNPQIKILDELKEIKDEIIEFGKTREIGDIGEIDIDNTVNELINANKEVNDVIEELTKIKNRLNDALKTFNKI
jgi:2-phosphoglycerate kinase